MASTIHHQHCPCCHSVAISKAMECKDYTVSHEVFEVWKCSNCTAKFTQHVPDAAHIDRYYKSANYVSHSDTKKGIINRLYHVVRNITLRNKCSLITKATGLQHGSLLDIGAGTGAFAHTMQRAQWKVTGLEPDDNARAVAFSNYNLQLQELGNLSYLQADSFDVITLWHVLEHVHELHAYVERFYQLLKRTGMLFIAVPNYCSYDATVYKQHWAAYDVPRHLYHFSPKAMQLLLAQKGFALKSIKPMWFDSFYVSMLSEQYRNGSTIRGAWTGLVSNLKAVFEKEKCSSIIYIAVKT